MLSEIYDEDHWTDSACRSCICRIGRDLGHLTNEPLDVATQVPTIRIVRRNL